MPSGKCRINILTINIEISSNSNDRFGSISGGNESVQKAAGRFAERMPQTGVFYPKMRGLQACEGVQNV